MRPVVSDIAQRLLSLNKWEQRRTFRRILSRIPLPEKGKVLDFGCGTGLFTPVFTGAGFAYVGYDTDPGFTTYSRRLYPSGVFTASKDDVRQWGPFDLVFANCCFHHIPDDSAPGELAFISSEMTEKGTFLFADVLKEPHQKSLFHRVLRTFEQGGLFRTEAEHRILLEKQFHIRRVSIERTHFFPVCGRFNPFYNDLFVAECERRTSPLGPGGKGR